MDDQKHMARFIISAQLLKELLRLPPEANIYNIRHGSIPYTFALLIEHPRLPPLYEGTEPITITDLKEFKEWEEAINKENNDHSD